jgi:photosystem II stability/assembly factor-like uncharacterized protein
MKKHLAFLLLTVTLALVVITHGGRARAALPDWENVTPPFSTGQFGWQTIVADPAHPGTVYVGSDSAGLLKSTNYGTNWARVDMPWGSSCATLNARLWTLALDTFTGALYTVNGYGCAQGVFKSIDGGVNWTSMLTGTGINADVFHIEADPYLSNHIIISFHSGSGTAESFNGGTTWTYRAAGGSGSYVFVLNNSSTWLLAVQDSGLFKTTNSGQSWTQVSSYGMQHGADQLYRRGSELYVGAAAGVLRSTNNGDTWALVMPSGNADGINAVIGDGTRIFTRTANTGTASTGVLPFRTSTDGVAWTNYNAQTFSDGPMSMAIDGQYIYASLWAGGIWRLPLTGGAVSTSTPQPPTSTVTSAPTTTATPTRTATPIMTSTATSVSSTATSTATAVSTTATSTATAVSSTATPTATATTTITLCEVQVRVNGVLGWVSQPASFCAGAHP